MKNKKFKVGDKVRAIDNQYSITCKVGNWEGIVAHVGDDGNFNAVTTKHIDPSEIDEEYYDLDPRHFELIQPETIVITNDGRVTTAWLKQGKKTVRQAIAKCSPDDEFSLETGAKLALERLFRTEYVKQDHYKVGDKIKLKDCFEGLENLFPEMLEWQGKAVTVGLVSGIADGVRIAEDDGKWFWNNHFIEGKAKEEPKKEEPMYKIGDRVRIVKQKTGKYWNSFGGMDYWLGKKMTIKSVHENGSCYCYNMKEDAGRWFWYPWMIEGKQNGRKRKEG